jgi:type IV pilus assembly protein PilA
MDFSFPTKKHAEEGFSLIELLLVVVVIGILAVVAVPSITKAKRAAQTGAVIGSLKTFATHQTAFMAVKGRYARIVELNTFVGNSFGYNSGRNVYKGEYRYRNYPSTSPTDTYLKTRYGFLATRTESGRLVLFIVMEQDGEINVYES